MSETNHSQDYVLRLAEHFKDGAPLTFQVLAARGQAFPRMGRRTAVRGKMRHCYENAYWLAQNDGLYYVEGLAVPRNCGLVIDHAWCVNAAGDVIDPTWDDGSHYFGVAFTQEGLASIYQETGRHSVFGNLMHLRELGVEAVRQLLLDASLPIHIE